MKKAVKALKRIASQKQTLNETEYLMSSPVMAERLMKAQEDIKNGKGKSIGLEDLWK